MAQGSALSLAVARARALPLTLPLPRGLRLLKALLRVDLSEVLVLKEAKGERNGLREALIMLLGLE